MSARWAGACLLLLASSGCQGEELVWVPFNASGQRIEVLVNDDCSGSDGETTLELESSLSKRHVGDAVVTPPCGPVGTEHEIAVEVFDEWQDLVGRVTVESLSGRASDLDGDGDQDRRDSAEYTLRQDSADIGVWAIMLQSLGNDSESRTDRLELVLWQPDTLLDDTVDIETTTQ